MESQTESKKALANRQTLFLIGSPSWTRTNDPAVNSRNRHQSSIFGTSELNFRVRNGNGWTLTVIDTDYIAYFLAETTTYMIILYI